MEEKEKCNLNKKVTDLYNLIRLFLPKKMSVTNLALSLDKDKKTIRTHLEVNFIKNIDYFQEKERGKILIPLKTAIKVAKYYNEKEANHA